MKSFLLESRARERLERRGGARSSATTARSQPPRVVCDARAPSRALLAAPNLSRGARRADDGKPCAPSARWCHDIFFVFSIWRAEATPLQRARSSPSPARHARRALDRTTVRESRRERSRNARASRRRADRTPRPPYLSPPRSSPKTSRVLTGAFLRTRFFSPRSSDGSSLANEQSPASASR